MKQVKKTIRLLSPRSGAEISLHTPIQRRFIRDEKRRADLDEQYIFKGDDMCLCDVEQSFPKPVPFLWEADGEAVVEVSRDPAFQKVEFSETGKNGAELVNFMIGTRYYWRVRQGTEVSPTRSFVTKNETPRLIAVDGNSNFRDLGGWTTEDGGVLRQGLLYRCSEFDDHIFITEKGARTLTEQLGIRTEIDLRFVALDDYVRVLKPYGIRSHFFWFQSYFYDLLDCQRRKTVADAFHIICDPSNYPLCFHCMCGADRAGTLAILIEAACGVPMEQIILDYEFTSLSIWNIRSRNYYDFKELIRELGGYAPGKPFSEAVRTFLRSIGVSEAELVRLRRALVEYRK